jgi:hypothetical protein
MTSGAARRPSLLSEAQLRQFTGLSGAQFAELGAQFAELLARVGPAWVADREARLTARERERSFGAGRPHGLPFAGRLLLALMYLRWNIPYRMLAVMFGTNKDSVNRAVAELTPLLAKVGSTAPDGGRIGDEAALGDQLAKLSAAQRAAIIDGSFAPIPRPGKDGWEAQRAQYSGHRHRHVNTFQAITDDQGGLLWVTSAVTGAHPNP